jgi:hypothetical protein
MSAIIPIVIYKEYTVLGVSNTAGATINSPHTLDVSTAGNLALGNNTINSFGNSTANSSGVTGYTVLPGGVILQWGTISGNTTGNSANFALKFPTMVLSFSVDGAGRANVAAVTTNTSAITVTSTVGIPVLNYTAIGR